MTEVQWSSYLYYLQTTFSGRFKHFLDIIDPRTLFTSQAKLERCVRTLQQYEEGYQFTNRELWNAQKIKQVITFWKIDDCFFIFCSSNFPFLWHFENRFRKHLKGNFSLIESKETLKCIGRICVCVFLHTLSRFLERFKSNLVYPRASRDGTRLR